MIVAMVVLAITVPIVFGSLKAYDRSRVETSLISEINRFISQVQLIYISGPGNSAVISFDASDSSFARIGNVTFGSPPGGSMASVIRYTISGQAEQMVQILSPSVPVMSQDNGTFIIYSGVHDIRAECVSGAADLNGDGIANDSYVRLCIVQ
ncbi:MAG: hypothetical protein PHU53_04715 [Thermoplasmata archaeon]|nr:hypothetical protein [Thermoplasmata archaeon]